MAKDLSRSRWLSSVGAVLAVAMPKGLCPICIAASGGVLASLGLGILMVERNVRWILAVTLTIGLVGFVLSARRHRRWWTVAVGAVAALVTMTGRLLLSDVALYGGMVLLVAALASDLWARRYPLTALVQIRLKRGGV
ncbi:MAG: hypothetical protein HYV09_03085 [Deltaproteobacteria bacterium]|nr:hypothetical protein [Deltaproteobacteria bacterium]